eukprot:TRINITY_DN3367_c0_g3_i1.p1 TRINITY_DN3367_c0_g3~~TRINITY_DN3367_c0_g3_i1.p1  ORF type:complete len:2582 (-),score=1035.41 TRINITY_DN3367_c0_g3_i1:96-7841(-)
MEEEVKEQERDQESSYSLYNTSLKQRKLHWKSLQGTERKEEEEEWTESIGMIFDTLNIYSDEKSKNQVEEFISKSAETSVTFIKLFVAKWVKSVHSLLKRSTWNHLPSSSIVLFRWSCNLLNGINESLDPLIQNASSAPFNSFATQQSLLFSCIASYDRNHPKSTPNASKLFASALTRRPNLFQHYVSLFSSMDLNLSNGLLVAPLFQFASKLPKDQLDPVKPKFVEWYSKIILSSSTQPSSTANHIFSTLITHISEDELSKIVLPHLNRVLRRTPELVMSSAVVLFKYLKANADAIIQSELISLVLPSIKSTNPTNRDETLSLLRYFALQSKSIQTVESIAQQIVKVFKEKLTLTNEKIAVATALEQLLIRTADDKEHKLATIVVNGLLDQLEIENNDDARAVEFKVLSKWLRCVPSFPEKSLKLFNSALNSDKETLRGFVLDTINQSSPFASPEKVKQLAPLLPSLIKVIKNSKGTIDGIQGLSLLANLSAVDESSQSKATAEKIWPTYFKADSLLFKPSVQTKLKEKDQSDLSSLFATILKLKTIKLSEESEETSSICAGLLLLGTNPSWNVRRETLEQIRSVHQVNEDASDLLLSSFKKLIQSDSFPSEASNQSITDVLLSCVSRNVKAEKVGLLAVLLNHPLLVSNSQKNALKLTSFGLKKISGDEKKIVSDNSESIIRYVSSDQVLKNSNENMRRAGLYCARSLSNLSAKSIFPQFCSNLKQYFEERVKTLNSMDEDKIALYLSPENEVFDTLGLEETIRSETSKSKNEAARNAAKKASAAPKKKVAVEEESLEQRVKNSFLAKEKEVRAEVSSLVEDMTIHLQLVSSLVEGNPVAFQPYLPQFVQICLTLLPTVLHSAAANTTRSLSKALDNNLVPIGEYLAHALIILFGEESYDNAFLSHLFEVITQRISKATKGAGLSSPSFHFVFPLIQKGFEKGGYSLNVQEIFMSLLEKHTQEDRIYPRGEMITTLITIMTNFPRYQQRGKDTLASICSGLLVNPPTNSEEEEDLVCLLKGIISDNSFVRTAVLNGLTSVPSLLDSKLPERDHFTSYLWIALSDPESENASTAKTLWELYSHPLPKHYLSILLPFISSDLRKSVEENLESTSRNMIASSIVSGAKQYPETLDDSLDQIISLYKENCPLDDDISDEKSKTSNPMVRIGVASVLSASGSILTQKCVNSVFDFLLKSGLYDWNELVRQKMIQVGLDVINLQGQSSSSLFPLFEDFLSKPSVDDATDKVREASVIFLGTVAKHLDSENPKIEFISSKLIDALKTPSESVQRAVSTCLIPLFSSPILQQKAEAIIQSLLDQLKSGSISFGERRGAAYGLAGVVKGLGIPSLKKYDVVTKLQTMVEDKKHSTARQGALFAFETLCTTLQRLFEPYVIQTLPKLLNCFGDNAADVREAVVETSRVIMGQLSAHGVKLVLPALLKALDDKSNWKTKKGSIELLGSMAFCAPKQLSSCLPMIVPKLSIVLGDSHSQVQTAAQEALEHIGSVIRNAEIQIHVPLLLKAINDPDLYTRDALEALIHTNFVHSIDPASLSIIAPILHRGNTDRSIETKKKAAQIVGNMCSLTEHKDLEPYLETMISDLKNIITDPIPEVRAISSKALGSLIKGMGEEKFSGLIPWLLDIMKSDIGSVERSGAAQGLSEILAALDVSKFESLLPEILANSNHTKPFIREGAIGLFVFLPASFTEEFQNYLDQVLPCILKGLSDETENVRDISLRAGQSIVNQYALTSLELILPALEEGLFNDSWRIRQSSVQLLGDLLFHVITKSPNPEQDPTATLTNAVGFSKRNQILAALYLIRSDVSSIVRQKALLVWKSVVQNTPKVLKEILTDLMKILIECLGSSNFDKRSVAGKTLGDLVQKLGERILPEIIPILEEGLQSDDADTRQGVCIGLKEVMEYSNKQHLTTYSNVLIPAVKKALCDELEEVREAAAQAFDILHKNIGNKALDDILPPLLEGLQDEASNSLDGLRQILAVKSNVVLPFLVPKLLKPPITAFNVKALASIAEVSGSALNQHLASLMPALLGAIVETEEKESVRLAAETIVLAVQQDGYQVLFAELIQVMRDSKDPATRVEAINLIGSYCGKTEVDYETEFPALLRSVMEKLNDENQSVQEAALGALNNIIEGIKKDNQANYVSEMRSILDKLKDDLEKKNRTLLAGFNLPKGIAPFVPMLLQGLKAGTPELREQAALGLGDVLRMTSDAAAKPFLIQITGPLIRIIVDRFPWQVKAAILQTLNLIILKGGITLKPFLPQLQTTFLKSLQDPTKAVRIQAAEALGELVPLGTKLDPLITELLNNISSSEGSIQETLLTALQKVLLKAGSNISSEVMSKVGSSLIQLLENDEENIRLFAAKSLGAYSKTISESQLNSVVSSLLKDQNSWQQKHSHSLALKSILYHSPSVFTEMDKTFLSVLSKWVTDEKVSVRQSSCETIGRIVLLPQVIDSPTLLPFLTILSTLVSDNVSDVKITALRNIKRFAKRYPMIVTEYLNILVPVVMTSVKDRTNVPVRLASERALMHLLQVHHTPKTLEIYCSTLEANQSRNIADYAKRILAKLVADSDDSDYDD